MSSDVVFKQDLPPKGGYAPINFKRIPAKTVGYSKYLSPACMEKLWEAGKISQRMCALQTKKCVAHERTFQHIAQQIGWV